MKYTLGGCLQCQKLLKAHLRIPRQAIWINDFGLCKNIMHIYSHKCLFFAQLHNKYKRKENISNYSAKTKVKFMLAFNSFVLCFFFLGPNISALHHKLFNLKRYKRFG